MSDKNTETFTRRVCEYASRLVCIACLFGLGLFVAQAVRAGVTLRPESHPTGSGSRDDENQNTADVMSASSFMPDAGYWSFPASELCVQRSGCSDNDLDERLDEIGQLECVPTSHDVTHLVSLAASNGAIRTEAHAGVLWSLDKADLRIRLLTSTSASPTLAAAIIATRGRDGWEAIQMRPKSGTSAGQTLLPLPSGSAPSCSRRSEAGEISMQLVTTTATDRQLLDLWKAAGWRARHTPWGDPNSFSYLCCRNDEVVYAWSAESSAPRTLMLTRTTPSDRGTDK